MRKLTILHTNDLHNKLSQAKADFIAQMKLEAPAVLLDAGDAVASGNICFRLGGEPILSRMSGAGYDAMAMGNREFHFLETGLRSKTKLASFPILSANLRSKSEPLPPPIAASVVLERGGLRVGVFGLSVPMITERMVAHKVSPYWFEDAIEVGSETAARLRSEVDLLIAVTHIGLQKDVELAERVPSLDLIVGGHTHVALVEPRMVGATPIVQAGWWGRCIGRVDVTLKPSGGSTVTARLIDLSD